MCPYPRSGAGKAAHGGAAGILLAGLLLVCLFHEPLGPGVNAQSMEGTCLQDPDVQHGQDPSHSPGPGSGAGG